MPLRRLQKQFFAIHQDTSQSMACFPYMYLALPCLALPCLALPCLALPCLALLYLCFTFALPLLYLSFLRPVSLPSPCTLHLTQILAPRSSF
ncbi:hypothetical protein V8C37DRAFT_383032 [Trichoderma ceciliae]